MVVVRTFGQFLVAGTRFVVGEVNAIGFAPLRYEAFEDKVWRQRGVRERLLRLGACFVARIKPFLDAGSLVGLKIR